MKVPADDLPRAPKRFQRDKVRVTAPEVQHSSNPANVAEHLRDEIGDVTPRTTLHFARQADQLLPVGLGVRREMDINSTEIAIPEALILPVV